MSQRKDIAWLGLELKVPVEWEIARHSLSPKNGRLMLVDERRHRMDLSWRHCEKEPDVARSCEDFKNRMRQNTPGVTTWDLSRPRGWTGFWYEAPGGEHVTRALRWERPAAQFIDILIITLPGDALSREKQVDRILKDFRVAARPEEATHWNAFGIHCRTPDQWHLVKTDVKPMNVTLHFEHRERGTGKPDGPTAAIQRLGMAGSWFNGNREALIQKKEPKLSFEFEETQYRGHAATRAAARQRTKFFQALTGQTRHHKELAWLCEPANSVFRAITVVPPKVALEPQDFEILCPPKPD